MGYDNTQENADHIVISMIETQLSTSYIPQEEKDEIERMLFDTELKAEQAYAILDYLKENSVSTDPRDQFMNF